MSSQHTHQGIMWKRWLIGAGIVLLAFGGAVPLLMQGIENVRESAERSS